MIDLNDCHDDTGCRGTGPGSWGEHFVARSDFTVSEIGKREGVWRLAELTVERVWVTRRHNETWVIKPVVLHCAWF